MRDLAIYDYKNYIENGTVGRRPSVRGIIRSGKKLALIHSLKYDYYKFPGGGIDEGETHEETLIREVSEEAGLCVIPESIQEYGRVIRKEKGKFDDLFIQENFYYFCEVQEQRASQKLDDYEAEEQFVLEWVTAKEAYEANMYHEHTGKDAITGKHMIEREANVLKLLMEEELV